MADATDHRVRLPDPESPVDGEPVEAAAGQAAGSSGDCPEEQDGAAGGVGPALAPASSASAPDPDAEPSFEGKGPYARQMHESIMRAQDQWLRIEEERARYGEPPYVQQPRTWADWRSSIVHSRCYQTFGALVLYFGYFFIAAFLAYVLFYPSQHRKPVATESRRQWQKKVMAAKLRMTYPEPCRLLVDQFSDVFGDFMACMMQNARPLRVCTSCVIQRELVEDTYKNMEHGTNALNHNCRYEVFGQTDIEILTYNFNFYKRMMELNGCDLCMRKTGYGAYDVNVNVVDYLGTHEEFRECINSNKTQPPKTTSTPLANAAEHHPPANTNDDHSAPLSNTNDPLHLYNRTSGGGSDPPAVCAKCLEEVLRQGRLLQAVVGRAFHPISEDVTCMDVVDAANETYRLWHCTGCPLLPAAMDWKHWPWYYYLISCGGVIFLVAFFSCWACCARSSGARTDIVGDGEDTDVVRRRACRPPEAFTRRRRPRRNT